MNSLAALAEATLKASNAGGEEKSSLCPLSSIRWLK